MGLLEMSISGAVLIAVIAVLRIGLGNMLPKKTFLILWGIVLLRLLVPLRIPSGLSIYGWMPQHIRTVDAGLDGKRELMQESDRTGGFSGERNVKTAGKTEQQNVGGRDAADYDTDLREQHSPQVHAAAYYVSGFGLFKLDDQKLQLLQNLWAAGCILCLSAYLIVYVICRRRFATSVLVKNDFVLTWIQEHGGRRRIQVRQSGIVKTPLTYGLFCPVILMPEHTDWENTKQLAYIFTHERVHIRRFDVVTKFVLAIALAVHWFNPFVWAMYFLCSRDLELSCDETVVRKFGEHARKEYVHTLLNMEEKKRKFAPLCSNFSKNIMEERILAIMKIRKKSRAAVVAAAILVCSVTAIFATSAQASKEPDAATLAQASGQPRAAASPQISGQTETVNSSKTESGGTADREAFKTDHTISEAEKPEMSSSVSGSRDSKTSSTVSGDGTAGINREVSAGTASETDQKPEERGDTGTSTRQSAAGTAMNNDTGLDTGTESGTRKFANISLNLDDGQAAYLYDAVTTHMTKEYEGVYSLSDFQVTFSNEMVCGDILSLDVEVGADMTLIRNPQDSPFVKGMRQTVEEISDAGKKKKAQKIYDAYLAEVMPYYQQPEETGFMYQVHLRLADIQAGKRETACEIFYRDETEGVWELCTDRAAEHFTDTLQEEDGRAYIKEMLEEQV